MKARIIFVLIVFGLSLGLTTTSAKAGPPWPAVVRQVDHHCYTEWLADDLTTITYAWMDLHEVYQPHTGIKTDSCHGIIDYSSPDFASIADICAHTDWGVYCNGNGNMTWRAWCMDEFGNFTDNTEGVATPSGQVNLTCHYKPPSP